jgi:hypothetical protein
VSYTIGGGTIPPATSVTPPLVVRDITELMDEELQPTTQDILININDEFLNKYSIHLKLLDEINYQLRSDMGDERIGVIKEGVIDEKAVYLKETIVLAFSESLEFEK